jgi:hypothetical protein
MSTATDLTHTAQEQLLAGVKQSQDVIVKAVETWANAVGQLPTPPVELPFSDELPKPQEVVDTTFDFVQKLLDAQREFARNVVKAASPVQSASAKSTKA